MKEHIERMEIEGEELSAKIKKLRGFLLSPEADKLSELQIILLDAQANAMDAYLKILVARILNDGGE